jgi:hypothetical protein
MARGKYLETYLPPNRLGSLYSHTTFKENTQAFSQEPKVTHTCPSMYNASYYAPFSLSAWFIISLPHVLGTKDCAPDSLFSSCSWYTSHRSLNSFYNMVVLNLCFLSEELGTVPGWVFPEHLRVYASRNQLPVWRNLAHEPVTRKH